MAKRKGRTVSDQRGLAVATSARVDPVDELQVDELQVDELQVDELVQRLRDCDASAFRDLVDAWSPAVRALPARQRDVLSLRDVHGFTAAEACAALGLSAQNQRVLLHRARAGVRARLEDYYRG